MSNNPIIEISEKFRVYLDGWGNHTLEQWVPGGRKWKDKITEPRWAEVGHFPNMQQVLRRVIDMDALERLEGKKVGLEEYIDLLNKLDQKYGRLCPK